MKKKNRKRKETSKKISKNKSAENGE